MRKYPWVIHPIFVFLFSLFALGTSFYLYIRWYLEAAENLEKFVSDRGVDPSTFLSSKTWIIILVLSVLVAIIFGGMGLMFSYYQKAIKLFWHQKNFIDGFTHELKTPIASLKLYIDTFLKHDLPREEQIKYLEYMEKDTKRLSQNVERVLSLGSLEAKNINLDYQALCIEEVIEDFLSKNQKTYANVSLVKTGFNEKHYLKINVKSFELLLSNLIENSIKYNKNETIEIEIKILESSSYLQLILKDNGIGIPKNELKKIFTKFYQVGRSDVMTAKGNGLGLSLVHHIARLHKAKITAFSEGEDTGATFTLSFPSRRLLKDCHG